MFDTDIHDSADFSIKFAYPESLCIYSKQNISCHGPRTWINVARNNTCYHGCAYMDSFWLLNKNEIINFHTL